MLEIACIGTLGRDAESKTSASGKDYTRLSIAVGAREQTVWITVTAFGLDPAVIATLTKGAKAYIEGRLSVDHWIAKDGAQRIGLSAVALRVEPLGQIGRRRPRRRAIQSRTTIAPHRS